MPISSPIVYPLINGKRQDGNAIEANFAGQIYKGIKAVNYTYKKTREEIEGTHPDALGKTTGVNKYTCHADMYLAEFAHWLNNILTPLALSSDIFLTGDGSGISQVPFTLIVNYKSSGMDWITDKIVGCTLDGIDFNNAAGSAALVRGVDLAPLKIYPNGIDLEAIQLLPSPGM
jgi:hypothetical protein